MTTRPPDKSASAEVHAILNSKGFLSHTPPNVRPARASIPADTACLPNWNLHADSLATLAMCARIRRASVEARRLLRRNQLATLFYGNQVIPASRPARCSKFCELPVLLSMFAKSRLLFYTARDQCLLDSVVLSSVLRSYELEAQLYIGVALMPFSAHAWVQVGSCVLDNSLDHIRRYTVLVTI